MHGSAELNNSVQHHVEGGRSRSHLDYLLSVYFIAIIVYFSGFAAQAWLIRHT
jgi:hypothetical protein